MTKYAVFSGFSYLRVGELYTDVQDAVDFATIRLSKSFFGGNLYFIMQVPPHSLDNNESQFPYCGFKVTALVDKHGTRYTSYVTHFSTNRFWLKS